MAEKQFTLAYLLNNEEDDWWAVRNGEITLWKEEVVDLLNKMREDNKFLQERIDGLAERLWAVNRIIIEYDTTSKYKDAGEVITAIKEAIGLEMIK